MPRIYPTVAADLNAFQKYKGWSNNRFADELGITVQSLRAFKSGDRPIRKHLGLTLAALAYGMQPYKRSMVPVPDAPTAGADGKASRRPPHQAPGPDHQAKSRNRTKRPARATDRP